MNNGVKTRYEGLYENVLVPISQCLEKLLQDHLAGHAHIDRIAVRAKNPDRFAAKALKLENGKPKYQDPFLQIQDQIAARIIVFYKGDVDPTERLLLGYFGNIEAQTLVPESQWAFGYFGRHLILALPKDAVPGGIDVRDAPAFFELQIKTLFQHAWSEANHDLGYKPPEDLTEDQQRYLAYTSAQAWGADDIFARLIAETNPA